LRILIVDALPGCRLTVATSDSAGDYLEGIELIETTSAELGQHPHDTWDLMITRVHEYGSVRGQSAEVVMADGRLRGRERDGSSSASDGEYVGRLGLLGKLLRRKKLNPVEREERRVTHTVVLAEIQREVGIALSAIEMGDFDTIGEIAMRIKDDGANYNFAKLSGLGAALYDTVPSRDIRTARNIAQKLMTYMGRTIGSYTA
jgi:hypothetical protein